jgi:hypothetical protein
VCDANNKNDRVFGNTGIRLEVLIVSIENARSLVQGVLLLVFAAIAYWVSLPMGLGLVAFMGIMKIQECRSNWCPSDPVLRSMGMKKRSEVA